jgi:very-short-patch-repair endonuclease/predicted transcriptional regulator of viral defense system
MRDERAPDERIAELAGGQGGVVAHRQLAALGLSASAIGRRIRGGRLHPIHRGVYAVGHRAVGVAGRRWAALLVVGDGAVISHATAGAAYDLRPGAGAAVHVTLPGRAGRKRRPGIRVHRPELLRSDEVTTLDGLPITTPARTLLDLAATGLRGRPLEAAIDQADRRRLLDFADLHELVARYPRRPGTPSLKAVLARYRAGDTRSELEALLAELCDAHDLPRPQENCVVEGKVRDFYWPHARLVVEADSYAWHRSPSALDDDRQRDVELTLAGYRTLRFTWEQVTRRRTYVVSSVLAGLRAP